MTREGLKSLSGLERTIHSKLDDIERLRSLAERTTTLMTGMPRGGGEQDKYNAIICRIWALEKELDADIDAFVDAHTEISAAIARLPDDRERLVLEMRYLCYRSWERIADALEVGVDMIYKIHGRALQHFT